MTSAQEWVPKVSRDLKLHAEWKSEVNVNKQTWWLDFNTGRCEMRNSVRLLILFLAAQYMLDWFAGFTSSTIILPSYQSPPNKWQKAERYSEQEIRFLRYRRAIEPGRLSCNTMQHKPTCIGSGWSAKWPAQGQINFSSFRKWSSSDSATVRVFWNDLGSSFKTPRNLGVSTRSFDDQLLENSSSRMRSQGPNDRVHAQVINFSSRWVSEWTRLLCVFLSCCCCDKK